MGTVEPTDVRPARREDLAALLPLLRGYCDFYEVEPSDEGLLEMAGALIETPDREGFLLVVCEPDGEVVGFAAVGWKWSSLRAARVAVMEDLFVDPRGRGRGHADALIAACAELAQSHGAPALQWLTAHDNHRAQAVYNRSGASSESLLEYDLELADVI